jgi:hypothetical protein
VEFGPNRILSAFGGEPEGSRRRVVIHPTYHDLLARPHHLKGLVGEDGQRALKLDEFTRTLSAPMPSSVSINDSVAVVRHQ